MPKRQLLRTSIFDFPKLLKAFQDNNIKESFIPKIYGNLIRNQEVEFRDIPDLPRAAYKLLEEQFHKFTTTVISTKVSGDGDTTKLVLELQDGLQVETVIIVYDTTATRDDSESGDLTGQRRATLCVSSQVGCKMGCTFCATGTMGIKGDLTCGEIIEQLLHARRIMPIRNVVFMGMGEPMNNYANVRWAVEMMTDSKLFSLRQSAVTVSTVGVIPKIKQMAKDLPGVSLALSLHAPTQELRKTLVPSASAYRLDKIMETIEEYQRVSKNTKVFVEYVLLCGVNDKEDNARELGQLLQGMNVVVNLIPWNPVYSPGIDYQAPNPNSVATFHRIVRQEYGVSCTVRREKGQDIAGACGQLVIENKASGCGVEVAGGTKGGVKDIEELAPNRPITVSPPKRRSVLSFLSPWS